MHVYKLLNIYHNEKNTYTSYSTNTYTIALSWHGAAAIALAAHPLGRPWAWDVQRYDGGRGNNPANPSGLVWEMQESSGWKRIEGDFEKFWLIMEIPPPQYPSFPFIPLIPKQALTATARPAVHCPRRNERTPRTARSDRGTKPPPQFIPWTRFFLSSADERRNRAGRGEIRRRGYL
jgi:hypothetical protein